LPALVHHGKAAWLQRPIDIARRTRRQTIGHTGAGKLTTAPSETSAAE
jgi:hypothetical protein